MEHGVNGVNGVVWKENFEKDVGYHVIVRSIHIIREHVSDLAESVLQGIPPTRSCRSLEFMRSYQ